ncbi:MAG: flagellar hook-basal body complex protein FliE, partial [Terracidiphilus sp.]|nr:flagellar hook-basal body complex protein FliE [Terracidiphilus sp.]
EFESERFTNVQGFEAEEAYNMLAAVNLVTAAPRAASSGITSPFASQAAKPTASSPFAELMTDAIGQVNALQQQAQTAVTGLMTGSGVDVHKAMIATQKADMAFELVLAVRNKAVQAYQSVMGMQF